MITTFALFALAGAAEANLQSSLDGFRATQQIPGVAAVVTHGRQTVFAGASGVADMETGREMTPDTIFYAGSLSKVFTAAMILQLADEGNLALADVALQVSGESVQVQHLLLHSSGLSREGDFNYWFNARFPDPEALREHLAKTRLRFSPGTKHSYSNIGYAALGPVIERASGMSYAESLDHYLTSKLDMSETRTGKAPAGCSAGYSPLNRIIPDPKRPFAGIGRRVGDRHVREYHDARAMTPAFGIFSSARDLSRFAQAMLGYDNDNTIPEPVRSLMLSRQSGGRGYAWRLESYQGRRVARHGGWFAAHRSYLLLDLDSGITITVLANSDSASPGTIAEGLLDAALRAMP